MMTKLMRKIILPVMLAFLSLSAAPNTAWAVTLDQAKQQGLVGERPDGLLGTVKPAGAEVVALVQEVNAKRLENYQQIASRNGTSVAAVQAIAGKELIQRSSPGTYVLDPSGQWVQK